MSWKSSLALLYGLCGLLPLASCAHRPSERAEIERDALRARAPELSPHFADRGWRPARAQRTIDLWGGVQSASVAATPKPKAPAPPVPQGPIKPILAQTGTVSFDIPMSDDARVEQWTDYLSARGSRWYRKWLARSTRFVPIFWRILDDYGLPRDLVFLSMIESGFSPRAYSWAHAAGPWQFIPNTGRRFGLKVGFWVDERRDFERATHAAAKYLSRLFKFFDDDWYLAFAAYNAGPFRMKKAIRRTGSRDFWKISRTWHLRRETRHYVPKLLAAARIAKQPEKYGFDDVEYLPPLQWEVMSVTVATDLKTLAGACDIGQETLKQLNPELRTSVTPPGEDYALRIPPGQKKSCERGLAELSSVARMTFRYHELSAEDSLEKLAQAYQTTPEAILGFNEIVESQLQDFEELVIPVPMRAASKIPIRTPPARRFRGGSYSPEGNRLLIHTVRRGDSLWRVARRYRVSLKKLRLWNGLWKSTRLRLGQKLRVYVGRGGAPSRRRRR